MYSLIGGGITLVLWGFSREIILLIYGDNFLPSIAMLNILSWAVFLFFIHFFNSENVLSKMYSASSLG